jgi:type IV pilus assembly protein PilX
MKRERGVVLVLILVVLIGVSMLALTAARSASVSSQSSRYNTGQLTAFAAAQAALADAELALQINARADASSTEAKVADRWRTEDLNDSAVTSEYGADTGRRLPLRRNSLPPRYLVEFRSAGQAGEDASTPAAPEYLVTAIGYGPDPGTITVLQSVYRKEAP